MDILREFFYLSSEGIWFGFRNWNDKSSLSGVRENKTDYTENNSKIPCNPDFIREIRV